MDPKEILLDDRSVEVFSQLQRDLADRSCNLAAFVGAGVSAQAGLPLWGELMRRMEEEVQTFDPKPEQVRGGLRKANGSDLLWLAEEYRDLLRARARYEGFLDKTFRRPLPDSAKAVLTLVRLNFRHFLTTNYDDLLEQAHQREFPATDYGRIRWTSRGQVRNFFFDYRTPGTPRHILHLHGTSYDASSVVLTHSDYVDRYVKTAEYVEKLTTLFATLRIVFVGFSLDDPDLMYVFRQVNARFADGDLQHYIFVGVESTPETPLQLHWQRRRLEGKYGIQPIFYDSRNRHSLLGDALAALETEDTRWERPAETNATAFSTAAAPPEAKRKPEPSRSDDPEKGRWGGSPVSADGSRRLSAVVTGEAQIPGLYRIQLRVSAAPGSPLTGAVRFHVHPTFARTTYTIPVIDNEATLELVAYGAFTVGAEADEGRTRLELDLAELADAPQPFRER